MSHDQRRHKTARPQAARAQQRPALERPSLFAPMDGDAEAHDTQRVHILSTLESARRPSRPPPSKMRTLHPLNVRGAGNWQSKALMGLMAMGIVLLLAAFAMLLLDQGKTGTDAPNPRMAAGDVAADTTQHDKAPPIEADARNPLAALVTQAGTPPSPAPAPAQQTAAVIENTADAATVLAMAEPAQGVAPQAIAIQRLDTPPVKPVAIDTAPLPVTPTTQPMDTRPPTPHHQQAQTQTASTPGKTAKPEIRREAPRSEPTRQATRTAHADVQPPSPPRTRVGKDDDVALLEAMLAHSATRKPAARQLSVADELRQCGELSGGAAATCRARICVQSPTAPACHQTP